MGRGSEGVRRDVGRRTTWASTGVMWFIAGCQGPVPVLERAPTADAVPLTIVRIVDGDTFVVGESGTRVRLWGIDAPERGDVPAGQNATAWLRVVAEDADHRFLCEERDRDRDGRTVAECFTPDGQDIQAAMIAAGHAVEWCRYSEGAYGQCGIRGGRARD